MKVKNREYGVENRARKPQPRSRRGAIIEQKRSQPGNELTKEMEEIRRKKVNMKGERNEGNEKRWLIRG